MNELISWTVLLVYNTDTTVEDDFLNLYPEDVPDSMGGLAATGFAFGPFVFAALLFVSVGVAMVGVRRRRT